MSRFKRVLAGAAVLVGGLAFASSSSAGANFEVPLTPGHFKSSSSSGFVSVLDSAGNDAVVRIAYGRLMFRLKGGSKLTPVNGTAVYASMNTPDGAFVSGCWLLPTNALVVNRDMSASVSFDSSAPDVSPCPGLLVNQPLTAAAAQPVNLDPAVQGFTSPVRFSLHWTPRGPADVVQSVVNSTCQTWSSVERLDRSDSRSAAAGDFSATGVGLNWITGTLETISINGHLDTATGGDAEIMTDTDDEVVNGPSTGSCGPYGS